MLDINGISVLSITNAEYYGEIIGDKGKMLEIVRDKIHSFTTLIKYERYIYLPVEIFKPKPHSSSKHL